jgi:hypothetical protein
MNISDEGLRPDEKLRVFLPTIDSRNIGLDGVHSYRFITSSYIDRRIGRLKAFAKDSIEGHPCILGGDLKSLLDDVSWKSGEMRTKGIIVTWCLRYLAWSMVTRTSMHVRVCILTADIMMSISPEDTMVGSHLNIHVSVIVPVGVSVNKCRIPWSVEEYIVLVNKNLTSRCIRIRSKIGLVYNTVTVVSTKVEIGVQQRRIILLFIPCRVITLFMSLIIGFCRKCQVSIGTSILRSCSRRNLGVMILGSRKENLHVTIIVNGSWCAGT